MPEKLIDDLKRRAALGKKKAEQKRKEKASGEQNKAEREAQERLAQMIIQNLPERLIRAAEEGEERLRVYVIPYFDEPWRDFIAREIRDWAIDHGVGIELDRESYFTSRSLPGTIMYLRGWCD